jgi:hypothetical protein
MGWLRNGAGHPAPASSYQRGSGSLRECAEVNLLRRVLVWQAALWAALGLALVVVPGWLAEALLDQPPLGEDAWLRAAGVMAIALAGQMVLVARRIEDLWWWSWTFVLLELATALVFLVNAVAGLPPAAATWPWWVLGGLNGAVAAVEVAALAKTGTETPPV